MTNSKLPRIVKERVINNKVWQIISFLDDSKENFDVVFFDKSNAEKMVEEIISSKKIIKTYDNLEEALKFLEEQV